MKKIKIFSKLMLFALLGIVLASFAGMLAIPGVVLAVGTTVTGGTLTQQEATGGDSYDETKQYLDMKDVQKRVELYKPYQTPLLSILSDNKVESTDSWDKKYYAVDARGLYATVSSATVLSGSTTTLTVDDSTMFTMYNTVYFTGITTAPTLVATGSRYLVGIITAFPASNQITVQFINKGSALANTDLASEKVYRSGSAHNESAASTTAWGIYPETDYNYVQYFMEQVEETEFQQLMKKEANWGINDLKRLAIEDFKLQRERAFLGGVRSVTSIQVNGKNQRFYTCGGFLNDVGIPVLGNQNLANLTSAATFVTWLKTFFTGNNGSRTRFCLGGADIVEAIEKVNVDNKWLLAKETQNIYGIDFVKMVSSFGTLNLTYYEQLDLLGKPKTAMVLDKANMATCDLEGAGFNVRKIDYKSSGVAKVDAAAIEQSSTLLIKNKKSHHIIEGV